MPCISVNVCIIHCSTQLLSHYSLPLCHHCRCIRIVNGPITTMLASLKVWLISIAAGRVATEQIALSIKMITSTHSSFVRMTNHNEPPDWQGGMVGWWKDVWCQSTLSLSLWIIVVYNSMDQQWMMGWESA